MCQALGRGLCRHSALSSFPVGKYYHLCVSPMVHEAQRPKLPQLGSNRAKGPNRGLWVLIYPSLFTAQ